MPSSVPDTIFSVQLPSWRLDLEREIDLIEEVARVYGYNRFANTLPTAMPVIVHPTAAKEAVVRTRLLALGYSESISSTFTSQADAAVFYEPNRVPHVRDSSIVANVGIRISEPSSTKPAGNVPQTVPMENPLSEEASLLRPSLIPGMLNMLAHNLNRDVKDVRLFEQGQIFTATVFADSSIIDAVHESPQLSLGLTGNPTTTDRYTAQSPLFFELKGTIESVLSLFDLKQEKEPSTVSAAASGKEPSFRPEAAHFAAAVEKSAVCLCPCLISSQHPPKAKRRA
jgi:phenylalanyl-tRNA synthetase beta chain